MTGLFSREYMASRTRTPNNKKNTKGKKAMDEKHVDAIMGKSVKLVKLDCIS